jgi:ubiquinone/menaquinone biosynthesis C-methylase UbiE
MADVSQRFDDGAAYEAFMGRWSHAAGRVFLQWLAPPRDARWLDVGCGTGVFTQLILETCSPSELSAVDPAQAQIDHARRQPMLQGADFQVADAQALPFADGAFDVIASALVINFIPDRQQALSEMRRVTRPGGVVAGYVWDFAAERSPSWPMRAGLRVLGAKVPDAPGTADSTLAALDALFHHASFEHVDTRAIDVSVAFTDFAAFWRSQAPGYTPIGKLIAAMSDGERARLVDIVEAAVPAGPDGSIEYSARAHAVKARVPD